MKQKERMDLCEKELKQILAKYKCCLGSDDWDNILLIDVKTEKIVGIGRPRIYGVK